MATKVTTTAGVRKCVAIALAAFLPLIVVAAPSLTLIPEATSITSAERVWIEITATAAPGTEVRLPFVGSELGGFVVRDRSENPPRLDAAGEQLQASLRCLLEPALSGDYEIPALTTTLEGVEISSQPVTIAVSSVLPEVTKGLAPKEALGKLSKRPWWVYGLVIVLGLVTGGLLALKGRQSTDADEQLPGEVLAEAIREGRVPEDADLRGNVGALLSERTGLQLHNLTVGEIDATPRLPDAARQPLRAVLEALDHQQFGGGSPQDLTEELKRLEAAL